MVTALRFLGLVLILNLIRYVIGGPIEGIILMEPMHAVMPKFPEVFDTDFTNTDFVISLFYNFMLWFTAVLIFRISYRSLKGSMILRSMIVFLLLALFFISLAAIYMNHYTAEIKTFYMYSMLDALILFPLVGLANGLLYRPLMGIRKDTVRGIQE